MIVGVLVWYDESPEMLANAVSGFARVCDQIVAVDGAYALYPQAKPCSHPGQASTILHAAEAAGAGCLVHRPQKLFMGNEVEKRNLSLELARPFDPNWILVFDGDFQIAECHPELVRADLAATDLNVASYELCEKTAAVSDYTQIRAIYRWTDDLVYGPAHYVVRGTYDGERQELRGQDEAEALWLGNLSAYHLKEEREKTRRDSWASYTKIRDFYGVEALDVVA